MCPVQHILWLTIRARDAEVREAARAEALAGFEWVEPECEYRSHGINCECYGPLDRPRQGRLIGPWEPTP